MRRASTWLVVAVLALVLALAGWRIARRLAAHPAQAAVRVFYVAEPGRGLRFAVGDARELHLVCHPIAGATELRLTVAFADAAGAELDRRELAVAVPRAETTLPDGTRLAAARLVRLAPPDGAATLALDSVGGRALVRLSQPSARHLSRERALRRAGVDPAWLGGAASAPLDTTRWVALTAVGDAATMIVPASVAPAPPLEPTAHGEPITAARAGVWNVVGPGTLRVRALAGGPFAVQTVARAGATADVVSVGGEPLTLTLGGEPTTLLVRSDAAPGAIELEPSGVHEIGGPGLARANRRETWWSASDGVLRFALADARPLRLRCRHVGGERCRWRFTDGRGATLRDGTLAAPRAIDPYAAVEREPPAGIAAVQYLVPPAAATALELRGADVLVQLAALAEEAADERLAPPFDAPVAPLRWLDAPARTPRWIATHPLAEPHARPRAVALAVAPHLGPRAPASPSEVVTVFPSRAAARRDILEASRAAPGAATAIPPRGGVEIRVDDSGARARRVEVRCDVAGALGGELALRIDGAPAARASIPTATVRLVAAATPGAHRVSVDGPARARCTVLAAAVSDRRVQRSVFSTGGAGARLQVTKPAGAWPLHFAVYGVGGGELTVEVDGGQPRRQSGAVERITSSRRQLRWAAAAGPTVLLLPARESLSRALVGTVLLGDDLPAGAHTIDVRAPQGAATWVRFWAPGHKAHREKAESFVVEDEP